MNRKELVDAISQRVSLPKKVVNDILGATLDVIMETTSKGEDVALVGFGSFKAVERKGREGRNPKTGEPITIPETVAPVFSAGKTYKELVAGR